MLTIAYAWENQINDISKDISQCFHRNNEQQINQRGEISQTSELLQSEMIKSESNSEKENNSYRNHARITQHRMMLCVTGLVNFS